VTLAALEIVLGIDNIVFISILSGRLPPEQRSAGRRTGLALALGMRVALLFALSWVVGLTRPFFTLLGHEVSGRDLILLAGGAFLIAKATYEIHDKLEAEELHAPKPAHASFFSVIAQIGLLDVVFSLDSVITAVGMAREIAVMVAAVVIAILVMMAFANPISEFIERHPTFKMLALSFLLLIGVMLVLEGFGTHVEKGYIYSAMGFSIFVELLNIRLRRPQPVHLRRHYADGGG
jgi:predicted tellurium resistance membrane protein TerC